MKLLIASTTVALVLAGLVGRGAKGADTVRVSENTSEQPNHAMIAVMPASQIVGRDLQDPQGIDAGKINSLVIDTKSGVVEFVMITPPSSFNAANQLIAAPWSALGPPATANGPLTTKFGVDKLAKAPRLDPRLIYEFNRPELRNRLYGYYGAAYPGFVGMDASKWIIGKESQNELGAHDRQIDLAYQNGPTPPSVVNTEHPVVSSALVFTEDSVIAKLEKLKTTTSAQMHDSNIYDSKGKDRRV